MGADRYHNPGNKKVPDQMALVLANGMLMAQSSVLVGPQISNLDRVLVELMAHTSWRVTHSLWRFDFAMHQRI
jgi:hypothetical protein